MDTITNFITPGLLFILTLIFGFWLSKAGKPYNGILFNIHKLIALGTVILTVIRVYNIFKIMNLGILIVVLLVVVGICVIALFASGAFMSIRDQNYQTTKMKTVHNIALVFAVIAIGALLYLL
jgi:hypothetical protein